MFPVFIFALFSYSVCFNKNGEFGTFIFYYLKLLKI